MSVNSALILLNEAIEIYSRLYPIGNRAARDAAFQPVKYRLNHLRQIVELDYPGMSQYVDKLVSHYESALATKPIGGNSPEQHKLWADSAIRVLMSELSKGQ